MNTIDLYGDGSVVFSRDREVWSVNGEDSGLRSRLVTETSPNGSVHMRLASAVEDMLLDRNGEIDALRSALERTLDNFRRSLRGGVVRDATETIAEAEAALRPKVSENPDLGANGCPDHGWIPQGHCPICKTGEYR